MLPVKKQQKKIMNENFEEKRGENNWKTKVSQNEKL